MEIIGITIDDVERENIKKKNKVIISKIEELENKANRSMRAIILGKASSEDVNKLSTITSEIDNLRTQLK